MTYTDLKSLREEIGLTQTAFAERADIGRAYYSQLESGAKDIGGGVARKIASAYGVTVAYTPGREDPVFLRRSGTVGGDPDRVDT